MCSWGDAPGLVLGSVVCQLQIRQRVARAPQIGASLRYSGRESSSLQGKGLFACCNRLHQWSSGEFILPACPIDAY